jgi:hypothetical protein
MVNGLSLGSGIQTYCYFVYFNALFMLWCPWTHSRGRLTALKHIYIFYIDGKHLRPLIATALTHLSNLTAI